MLLPRVRIGHLCSSVRLADPYPSLNIIGKTISEDTNTILNAIKAGAYAYVLKFASGHDLIHSIQ
ncbi:MAG: hypothetical protein GF344_09325 [Chitinivibrionales bacterium]|nr:hypothetical protein [Chitinivibrionales bacterium]MBD3357052.1 hypothetical protein [Chitinivibrionales bacterium]